MRRELARLRRMAEADEDSQERLQAFARALVRERGESALLEPLADLRSWRRAPRVLKRVTMRALEAALPADFERGGWLDARCENHRTIFWIIPWRTVQETRVAVFHHRGLGLDFHVIPGEGADLPPFLLAQQPLSGRAVDRGQEVSRQLGTYGPLTRLAEGEVGALLERHGLRLPSPREWWHACRAGTSTRFFWGEQPDDAYAWHRGNSGGAPRAFAEHTRQRAHNPLGLVDMIGNVAELCADKRAWGGHFEAGFDEVEGMEVDALGDPRVGVRPACDLPQVRLW